MDGSPRAFVVQEHQVAPGDLHYDLMIEAGEVLVTFQLDEAPRAEGVVGRRSFDHRRRYLDYEGPISQDRGEVRIWDRGQVEDLEGDPRASSYRLRFSGRRLRGEWALHEAGERVRLARESA
ncbi:MAG TPA: hypothetical protein DEA08_30690 [Planctomycetes bacterium]|nr:hypothetical protein [Planctomycetota bacterium]